MLNDDLLSTYSALTALVGKPNAFANTHLVIAYLMQTWTNVIDIDWFLFTKLPMVFYKNNTLLS